MKKLLSLKLLALLLALLAGGNTAAAAAQPRPVDVNLVAGACAEPKLFGTQVDEKNIVLINSADEAREMFKSHADADQILSAVAFAEFGKFPVYINTWDTHLWRNIADPHITDPGLQKTAAVIAASLINHEIYHAREPITAFDGLSPRERSARIYQSEIGALGEEPWLLKFFREQGIGNLSVPIARTEASILDFTLLAAQKKN